MIDRNCVTCTLNIVKTLTKIPGSDWFKRGRYIAQSTFLWLWSCDRSPGGWFCDQSYGKVKFPIKYQYSRCVTSDVSMRHLWLCVMQGSGHVTFFMYISPCGTSSCVSWYRCLTFSCRFQRGSVVQNQSIEMAFIFVCFIKRCQFVDLCQTRVGRWHDNTNIRW